MDAEPARAAEPYVERAGGSPGGQLARLLGRADNGPQVAPGLAAARDALMHYCGLQSCRHSNGPPRPMDRRTYRHSFLLPDGGVRVVWELEHSTGPGGKTRRSVFTERGDLAVAEWEADAAFGRPASSGAPAGAGDPGGMDALGGFVPLGGLGGFGELDRLSGLDGLGGSDGPVDLSGLTTGLEDLAGLDGLGGLHPAGAAPLPAPEPDGCHRAYTESGSPEHARRLLRRAANAGGPGAEVRDRLGAAIAHTIGIVTRRSALVAGRTVCWSLYEHAFLLLDGTELSLWEIDHTRTPTGDPVCEVYSTKDAALDTVVRRIEAGW